MQCNWEKAKLRKLDADAFRTFLISSSFRPVMHTLMTERYVMGRSAKCTSSIDKQMRAAETSMTVQQTRPLYWR
jgi:hypothetical protein